MSDFNATALLDELVAGFRGDECRVAANTLLRKAGDRLTAEAILAGVEGRAATAARATQATRRDGGDPYRLATYWWTWWSGVGTHLRNVLDEPGCWDSAGRWRGEMEWERES